jgi:UDP-N-acetylmuramyl pentapeptide phosphotransferase/UDP-N-acetylglucosamine-1-phosphate transferase
MTLQLAVIFTVLLSWLATRALRHWAPRMGLVDIPNERSSHNRPTPRGGGLSFVVVSSALMAWAFFNSNISLPQGFLAFMIGALVVACVSLLDDFRRLPYYVRLGVHGAGALILLVSSGWICEMEVQGDIIFHLGWLGLPLTIIWLIGFTNAYNFMDGIDGLASGQAIIAAVIMAWLAALRGADSVTWAMLILASSVFGFLIHNWPPAKIFMGDVGSSFLGFTFAGWAVLTNEGQSSNIPFLAWPAVQAPFIFDTALTLIIRTVRRKRLHEAHCEHFYQRLVRSGWSHLKVTSFYLSMAAIQGLVTIAHFGYRLISPGLSLALILAPLFSIRAAVYFAEVQRARQRESEREFGKSA